MTGWPLCSLFQEVIVANISIRRASGWVVRRTTNLLQFGWQFVLFEAFNWIFNYPFFSLSLWYLGPVWGAIVPSILAIGINAFVFWYYEHKKVDWLKAHAMRQVASKENKTRLEKILTWHLMPRRTFLQKMLGELQFALLLSQIDPVIVAVHYRESHFEGLTRKDWLLLFKATAIALAIWVLILEPVVFAVKIISN